METGKTVRGGANLAFDAVDAVTHIVEGMYRNIAATPWPLGDAPEGPARGIAGFVHAAVRQVNRVARVSSDHVLATLAPTLDRTLLPGAHREAVIAALNGVFGDHLESSGNTLAIPLQMRVMLPAVGGIGGTTERQDQADALPQAGTAAFGHLFDADRRSVQIHPQAHALAENDFTPGRRLLVLLHGLAMNEREWTSRGHNHAEVLAEKHGYTPVYVLYNSGRHISTNGRELSTRLAELLANWPCPVESVTFMGFSMGGLVARSAMHTAEREGHAWLGKVDKAVYIGTPHHGAVMERAGFWLQKSATFSPYTAPLSALGRVRSAGITDLRHGAVTDDDWQHHDEHDEYGDRRLPTPLPEGVEHFAIAGTLSKGSGEPLGRLLGDGLVHPSSATGRHGDERFNLAFPDGHTRILYGVGHLSMLHDTRVTDQLQVWLATRGDR